MAPASQSSNSTLTQGLADAHTSCTSSVPAAPKAAAVKDLELGLERPSLKRKEVESSGGNRFKVVSQLVIAMKRFQASLNPTYTYGKRPSASGSSSGGLSNRSFRRSLTPADTPEVTSVQSVARQNSRAGEKGAPKAPRPKTQHGHKFDYLFSSLPPAPGEPGARPPTPAHHTDSMRSLSATPN